MATLEGFIRSGHLGAGHPGHVADGCAHNARPCRRHFPQDEPVADAVWLRPARLLAVARRKSLPAPRDRDRLPAEVRAAARGAGNQRLEPGRGTERAGIPRLHRADRLPAPCTRSRGTSDKAYTFLSGVTALVSDGMLQSLRLQEKEVKATPPAPVADEREATLGQIEGMLVEAEQALFAGASRAALMVAWAGLEATLRRIAAQEGRQGKIGVAPHILLRWLLATGRLSAEESRWLEMIRPDSHRRRPRPIPSRGACRIGRPAHRDDATALAGR